MAFAVLPKKGSGAIAIRIVIEGLPIEFVSDPAMEKTTADGRRRIYCADADVAPFFNASIEDRVNIPEAVLDPSGCMLQFFEPADESLSAVFGRRADRERHLNATISASDTTLSLLSVANISEGDVLHLGTEAMKVTSVGSFTIEVERAYWDTIAQKHWSNEPLVGIEHRIITNRPERIRGRRVYFFLYDDADDLTGDGEQVWIGTVSSEPALDNAGTTWHLMVDSIGSRLASTMGGELENPLAPRGIYYSYHAPLHVTIVEITTGGPPGGAGVGGAFVGFFETQEAFCAALTAWLDTHKAPGTLGTYRAVPLGSGGWTLEIVCPANLEVLQVHLLSEQDGLAVADYASGGPWDLYFADGSQAIALLGAGDVVYPSWTSPAGDARGVPRGYYGAPPVPPGLERWVRSDYPGGETPSDFPPLRIYTDGVIASDATAVRIEWGSGSAFDYTIRDRNNTSGWIELRREPYHLSDLTGGGSGINAQRYGASTPAKIRPSRLVAAGDLGDLIEAITTNAPEYCNRGTWPFLTSTDVDVSQWQSTVSTLRRYSWLTDRVWRLTTPVELDELLSAEMRLLGGVYPIVLSDGRIGIAAIELPSFFDATPIDDELISVGWTTLERGGQTINTIVVRTHYDATEDDWRRDVTIRNAHAFAMDHEPRTLEIKPRSLAAAGEDRLSRDELTHQTIPLISIFSYPYDLVTVNVAWTHFGLALGDAVRFSAIHLPDSRTGARPMDDVLGIVVSRKWTIGEPHGTLTLLLPGQQPSCYTPTARVTVATAKDSDWILTVEASMYAPSGAHPLDYWKAGYRCRIVEYDSESATVVAGTVKAVNKDLNQITVTFDSTFTPGFSTWELVFPPYDDRAEGQGLPDGWAYVAETDERLDGDPAARYAP